MRTLVVFFDLEGRTAEDKQRLLNAVTDAQAAAGIQGFAKFEWSDEKIFDVTVQPRGKDAA